MSTVSSASKGAHGVPTVLVAEPLAPDCVTWLRERCTVIERPFSDTPTNPTFNEALAQADALIVRTYTAVNADLLAKAPKLRVVGRAGVGLDNIDLHACRQRSVRVVHTPGANTDAVVEFVVACMLDATRHRLYLQAPLAETDWNKLRDELVSERQLSSLTLGIYGLGRIGSRVARAAAALNMRVIYLDTRDIDPAQRHGATPVDRETLLAQSDIISLHVDARPENRNLLNADAFGRMRSNAVFINAARGFLVDPFALAEFMIAHPRATAIIDVHEPEPFGPDYPLLDIDNIHLTPHIAAATRDAKTAMSWVVKDIWKVLSGEPPEHEAL
ncbi:MAG: 3-phosphoglycerate dehydrogenase [Phycisphaerales bacterium]|nr:MAG: 3-phosphoglycerate dehydrogenase [Phycisphaerales bacterium]